jgi:nucleoside-diphosphate-sugar epimerase
MRIYVAGGSGAIGRRLIPQLIAAGHDVVGTASSHRGIEELEILGAHPMVVDGLHQEAVLKAVGLVKPDAVINEMTALAGATNLRNFDRAFERTNQLRTSGNDYLIRAAEIAGVPRLISQSYTGWTNPRHGKSTWTEDEGIDPNPPKTMRRSLEAIEYLERRVTQAKSLEGVALRYGSLYGPGFGSCR